MNWETVTSIIKEQDKLSHWENKQSSPERTGNRQISETGIAPAVCLTARPKIAFTISVTTVFVLRRLFV